MLLRAAIVVLLVLNIGVAAWWMGGGSAKPFAATAVRADAPSLRLVSEPSTKPAAPAPIVAIAPPPSTTTVPAPAATEAVETCLRFGPFADVAARDAANAALTAAGVTALPRETKARSARGWRVFLPALASREAATAMAERIKAVGISDLYVMNQGEDANSIALGRFGGEEAARRREAEHKAKGIPAQAAPLGETPAQSWLDARLAAGANRAAIAALAPSKPVDCAGLR